MTQLQSMTLDELLEEFEDLEDWEDRCDFLIDLGFTLPELPADAKVEENRVHGCQSNVWMIASVRRNGQPTIEISAGSDAMIVRGLIAVLLMIFSGRTPDAILATDVRSIFARLELDRHLSTARRNGLYGMVKRIRSIAERVSRTM